MMWRLLLLLVTVGAYSAPAPLTSSLHGTAPASTRVIHNSGKVGTDDNGQLVGPSSPATITPRQPLQQAAASPAPPLQQPFTADDGADDQVLVLPAPPAATSPVYGYPTPPQPLQHAAQASPAPHQQQQPLFIATNAGSDGVGEDEGVAQKLISDGLVFVQEQEELQHHRQQLNTQPQSQPQHLQQQGYEQGQEQERQQLVQEIQQLLKQRDYLRRQQQQAQQLQQERQKARTLPVVQPLSVVAEAVQEGDRGDNTVVVAQITEDGGRASYQAPAAPQYPAFTIESALDLSPAVQLNRKEISTSSFGNALSTILASLTNGAITSLDEVNLPGPDLSSARRVNFFTATAPATAPKPRQKPKAPANKPILLPQREQTLTFFAVPPTVKDSLPAKQQPTEAPQPYRAAPGTAAPQGFGESQGFPEPQQSFFESQQGFDEPQQGFVESQGFDEPQQGFVESQGFGDPQGFVELQGFVEPQQGFIESQGFGEPQQGFIESQGFGEPQQGFVESQQGFGEPQQSFVESQGFGEPQGFTESQQGFGEPQQGFVESQGFTESQQGFEEPQSTLFLASPPNLSAPKQSFSAAPQHTFSSPAPVSLSFGNLQSPQATLGEEQEPQDSPQHRLQATLQENLRGNLHALPQEAPQQGLQSGPDEASQQGQQLPLFFGGNLDQGFRSDVPRLPLEEGQGAGAGTSSASFNFGSVDQVITQEQQTPPEPSLTFKGEVGLGGVGSSGGGAGLGSVGPSDGGVRLGESGLGLSLGAPAVDLSSFGSSVVDLGGGGSSGVGLGSVGSSGVSLAEISSPGVGLGSSGSSGVSLGSISSPGVGLGTVGASVVSQGDASSFGVGVGQGTSFGGAVAQTLGGGGNAGVGAPSLTVLSDQPQGFEGVRGGASSTPSQSGGVFFSLGGVQIRGNSVGGTPSGGSQSFGVPLSAARAQISDPSFSPSQGGFLGLSLGNQGSQGQAGASLGASGGTGGSQGFGVPLFG
ncbi:filaggrin-2-like [Eriocheir sinensis]|uniref:filaggrin-2-like n=1 Tax=Eriocheir sinensis TaxID=95602 RepID=UPI0021C5A2F0|nr:filaggrin-2-like [Eriocheir sinensis]